MKQLTLNKDQQLQFAERLNEQLKKVTMSWTNEMKHWYRYAIEALNFSSAHEMQVPQTKYGELLEETVHGLNMNTIMVLCNNLEMRSPHQMNMNAHQWKEVLDLNHEVAVRWKTLHDPIYKSVYKEFEIMAAKPKILTPVHD